MSKHIARTYVSAYRGRLYPTKAAVRELLDLGLRLEDCVRVLEDGYAPRKRKKVTVERWLDWGKKTYNVVAARSCDALGEGIWLVIHVGCFTRHRLRLRRKHGEER